MNPLDQKTVDLIKLAHSGRSKLWLNGLVTPQENAAMNELQGIDVVGILLDRSNIQTEILKQVQTRLTHIALHVECIGLEKCHDGLNCVHCLAKSDFKINVQGPS